MAIYVRQTYYGDHFTIPTNIELLYHALETSVTLYVIIAQKKIEKTFFKKMNYDIWETNPRSAEYKEKDCRSLVLCHVSGLFSRFKCNYSEYNT